MMAGTDALRASDQDRQDVVDRLRGAVGDGRLRMDEYMARMETAYQAVTLGDLAPLCADLAGLAPIAARTPAGPRGKVPTARARRPCAGRGTAGSVSRLPWVLRLLWATWLTAAMVNVVVWVLVSVTSRQLIYPWPVWVAGPYGALLLAISASASLGRRSRA